MLRISLNEMLGSYVRCIEYCRVLLNELLQVGWSVVLPLFSRQYAQTYRSLSSLLEHMGDHLYLDAGLSLSPPELLALEKKTSLNYKFDQSYLSTIHF